jgi:serine protease DegQ
MRAVLLSMVVLPWAACAPKVAPQPPSFDEDLPGEVAASSPAEPVERPVAPPGKGLRGGTIDRTRLVAVLDAGAGAFLRQLELMPKMTGDRFVGWELVQVIDRESPLAELDLLPGDVLLAINGKPVARPDQLQTVWESLRTANEVTAKLWRGDGQLTLAFEIEPRL